METLGLLMAWIPASNPPPHSAGQGGRALVLLIETLCQKFTGSEMSCHETDNEQNQSK